MNKSYNLNLHVLCQIYFNNNDKNNKGITWTTWIRDLDPYLKLP